jgi:LysM repeat protein
MNRSTLLLLVLLLALGAVTVLLLPSGEDRQSSYDTHGVRVAVDSSAVTRIDIRRPLSTTTIQNVGGVWMVTTPYQYAADPASVTQLVGGLAKFKVGSLVSSNPEKQRLFQVDSTGTFITVTDRSGAATQIVFGKMGPSFTEVYFRLPDSKEVYLGEGIDSWMLTREPKEWRDKTILAANTQAVTALEYSAGGVTTTFARDSSGWVSAGRRASIESLNPALTTLMALKADDFIDTTVQLRRPSVSLHVHGLDPVTLTLTPLDDEASKYALQSSKSRQLFVVSKFTASQLLAPTGRGAVTGERVGAPSVAASTPPPVKTEPAPTQKAAPAPVKKAVSEQPQPVKSQNTPPAQKVVQPPVQDQRNVVTQPARRPVPEKTVTPPVEQRANITPPVRKISPEKSPVTPPAEKAATPAKDQSTTNTDDEGELTIVTVKKGETMTTIAKKYNVTVDQIIKWNQLKSISVKPGMELYVFVKK